MTSSPKPAQTKGLPSPARFVASGLVATTVDLVLVVSLARLGATRLVADLIALVLAALVGRVMHQRYTLRGDDLDRWIRPWPVFGVVAAAAASVDLLVFMSLTSWPVWAAKVVAVACAAVLRASMHRWVLFRVVRSEQSQPAGRPPVDAPFRLSLVIPAFREEARIGPTIQRVRNELSALAGDLEIIVVDDGSPDNTAEAARHAGADVVLEQPENRGKGAAVRAGVLVARGRTVAFTDADLAYPPEQLAAFVDAIESGYDVAIGNRHHSETQTINEATFLRSLGSRFVNMATNLLLLGNYRDTQCGCKAFRSDVARIVMEPGRIDGFAFDIEVLHLVERHGLTMSELPVEVVNSDASTVRAVRDGIGVVADILRIRRWGRRGLYPPLARNALPSPSGDAVAAPGLPSDNSADNEN